MATEADKEVLEIREECKKLCDMVAKIESKEDYAHMFQALQRLKGVGRSARHAMAQYHYRRQEYKLALDMCREILDRNPGNSDTIALREKIYQAAPHLKIRDSGETGLRV